MQLKLGRHTLDLGAPRLMGVLNVTPDSFSDGGTADTLDSALARARMLVAEGAHLIDVGGESTRPGAAPVDEAEELRRVVPVIAALTAGPGVPVSVDTSKPAVMRAAVAAGLGVAVCLMHMQGEPRSMQDAPHYADVVGEVEAFLLTRAAAAEAAGIPRTHILLDPGFGFGKTLAHNLALLRGLPRLVAHGYPVLAGLSRKRLIGELTGQPVGARAVGSAVAALEAARRGARILRVHDVSATRDALAVAAAIHATD